MFGFCQYNSSVSLIYSGYVSVKCFRAFKSSRRWDDYECLLLNFSFCRLFEFFLWYCSSILFIEIARNLLQNYLLTGLFLLKILFGWNCREFFHSFVRVWKKNFRLTYLCLIWAHEIPGFLSMFSFCFWHRIPNFKKWMLSFFLSQARYFSLPVKESFILMNKRKKKAQTELFENRNWISFIFISLLLLSYYYFWSIWNILEITDSFYRVIHWKRNLKTEIFFFRMRFKWTTLHKLWRRIKEKSIIISGISFFTILKYGNN